MKSKALVILFAFSFVVQILQAQKTKLFFHTITFSLPQIADLSLSLNSKKSNFKKRANISEISKNANLWLNYHCILKGDHLEPSKNIKAQLTSELLNKNLSLSLIALKDVGKGTGDIGITTSNKIVLDTKKAFKIIDDIGIAYTGHNTFEGHNIIYQLHSKNRSIFNQNKSVPGKLSVTYTLFDN